LAALENSVELSLSFFRVFIGVTVGSQALRERSSSIVRIREDLEIARYI